MSNALNLQGIALSAEQGRLRRVAQRLAKEVLAPNAGRVDEEGVFPKESLEAVAQAGLMGLPVKKERGGPGGNIVSCVLVTIELAKGCASTAMCYHMHMSTVPVIAALANDVQVEKFLKPIVEGKLFGAFAMSERGSGNRLWHMDSFASQEGDDYIIDSFKSFATSSGYADYYLVPVRANQDVGPKDLSLFVIDGNDERVMPIGTWNGMGLRGNSSRPVHFNKCRVPVSNRLGSPTCGFSTLFAYSLPIYQVGLAAVYVGLAEAAYDVALEHVKSRIHSDTQKALSNVESVQRYIAEMRMRIDLVRCMVLRVAQMSDNATVLFDELAEGGILDEVIRENPDDPFFVEVAEVKIAACEMAIDVTNKAMQVCGGVGYKRGHPVERYYRDARAGSVMAPSDDTLKLIVGRQVLGIAQPWE